LKNDPFPLKKQQEKVLLSLNCRDICKTKQIQLMIALCKSFLMNNCMITKFFLSFWIIRIQILL
jgi:hypothetical protein